MATITEIIIKTLESFDITFDECLVKDIEVEVRKKCHTNPSGLAYAISRNKASDIVIKRSRERKRTAKELFRKEKERLEKQKINNLKKEFSRVEKSAINNVSNAGQKGARRNIDLCFLRTLESLRIPEIQRKFYPELSEVTIRKGIERGRLLILKNSISEDLRNKISTKRR